MPQSPYFFVSYTRTDWERVSRLLAALKAEGVNLWSEDELRPGLAWTETLTKALSSSAGLIVFISRNSIRSRWVRSEIQAHYRSGYRKLILPILLERVPEMPQELQMWDLVDASQAHSLEEIGRIAVLCARRLFYSLQHVSPEPPLTADESAREAREIVAELKARPSAPDSENTPPRSVFVIHGHDEDFLAEIVNFLRELRVEPVVLKRIGGQELSLWQKFTKWSKETRYAIALLSADDFGASRSEYEAAYDGQKVGAKALQFRARQNVVLELGYFYGYLNWDQVFVLFKRPSNPYPRFEMPSDLAGIVYDTVDEAGTWRIELRNRLQKAGFEMAVN